VARLGRLVTAALGKQKLRRGRHGQDGLGVADMVGQVRLDAMLVGRGRVMSGMARDGEAWQVRSAYSTKDES
jgi:hypothetical protein